MHDPDLSAATGMPGTTNEGVQSVPPMLQKRQERRRVARVSYQRALAESKKRGLAHFPWATWSITLLTCAIWCVTAYEGARDMGAHTPGDVLTNIFANSVDGNILDVFGAKDNPAIVAGQYWRLVTPVFLHANILHVGLNMLNFFLLGLVMERIFGHARFLLLYLLTGVVSILASFVFSPQEISVGASGAIFGLVGAYSAFILVHRQAFRHGGLGALSWLVLVIGVNLGLGLVIPGVDNYAHVGGLLSGCMLGVLFTPLYRSTAGQDGSFVLLDSHSLRRRWPLALLVILLILLLAIIAIHAIGG